MSADLEPRATLPWLVRLRWLAVVGQLAGLGMARALEVPIDSRVFAGVCLVTAASNAMLAAYRSRLTMSGAASRWLGGVLGLDTALLTLLLAASGGPMNPFTVFYVVHITLSAVVLSAGWTTLIASLSVLGFGLLFVAPGDPHLLHRAGGLELHLHGMWIAFVLASGFTAFFVRRITQAIRAQRDEIAALRDASARHARLASLTTLAAGAAHELGSPLGTIAVAAHEAAATCSRLDGAATIAEDLRLIELETERCRDILNRMAVEAADPPSASFVVSAEVLREHLSAHLGRDLLERVELRLEGGAVALWGSPQALAQSVAALVKNALDASPPEQPVSVRLAGGGASLDISIEDRGAGIPPELLPRVGEPFFTTKPPGHGLGLGVFLARAFVESLGGALALEPRAGGGTRAVLRLPASAKGALA